jgi:hypothetical protein
MRTTCSRDTYLTLGEERASVRDSTLAGSLFVTLDTMAFFFFMKREGKFPSMVFKLGFESKAWAIHDASVPFGSTIFVLTSQCAVKHKHDHVQNLLIVGASIDQTGKCGRLDQYVTSVPCTIEPLPRTDPVREEVS